MNTLVAFCKKLHLGKGFAVFTAVDRAIEVNTANFDPLAFPHLAFSH